MKRLQSGLPKGLAREWRGYFADHKKIKSVILFGSRARGDEGKRSDIDLAISAPGLSAREWLDISFFLEEEANTLLSVDAIHWEKAHSSLKKRISQEGRLVYERD